MIIDNFFDEKMCCLSLLVSKCFFTPKLLASGGVKIPLAGGEPPVHKPALLVVGPRTLMISWPLLSKKRCLVCSVAFRERWAIGMVRYFHRSKLPRCHTHVEHHKLFFRVGFCFAHHPIHAFSQGWLCSHWKTLFSALV